MVRGGATPKRRTRPGGPAPGTKVCDHDRPCGYQAEGYAPGMATARAQHHRDNQENPEALRRVMDSFHRAGNQRRLSGISPGSDSVRRIVREIQHCSGLRCHGPDRRLRSGTRATRAFTHHQQCNRGGGDACTHVNAAVADTNCARKAGTDQPAQDQRRNAHGGSGTNCRCHQHTRIAHGNARANTDGYTTTAASNAYTRTRPAGNPNSGGADWNGGGPAGARSGGPDRPAGLRPR